MIFFYALATAICNLIDEDNLKTLNRMFGDNYLICFGCRKAPGYYAYHHRNFHGR